MFAQWRRAAETATGDWLWIAEADDSSDPDFLTRVMAAAGRDPQAVLAFSDSRTIQADGSPQWDSYKGYDATAEADALTRTEMFAAAYPREVAAYLAANAPPPDGPTLAATRAAASPAPHFRQAGGAAVERRAASARAYNRPPAGSRQSWPDQMARRSTVVSKNSFPASVGPRPVGRFGVGPAGTWGATPPRKRKSLPSSRPPAKRVLPFRSR